MEVAWTEKERQGRNCLSASGKVISCLSAPGKEELLTEGKCNIKDVFRVELGKKWGRKRIETV